MARGIIHAPRTATRGQVIEIRALVGHAMETGHRAGGEGGTLPRDIVRRVECRWGGELVFAADLHPAVAANPYLSFHVVAQAGGAMTVRWLGDNGFDHSETVNIEVA